jgi:UDP-3-O-[3-hydroxymyristoyl] N-acetylglucosamine deacetylase
MAVQKTLRSSIALSGVGLHTGRPIHLRILPAAADTGIVFRRVDLSPVVDIPARSQYVADTTLATVLAKAGAEISTVEHCLAALAGLGVDNAVVEVNGPELPILDGSAAPYVEAILEAGLRRLRAPRKAIRVEKPLRVEKGDKFSILRPADGFKVTYSIDFGGGFPGSQHFYVDVTAGTFAAEIGSARTFGFLHEVEALRAMGKARGGSLENAVVLDCDRVLNPEGLRMPDEFVRHKILDAIGDMALAGMPILGHLIVHKGGHALHDALIKCLHERPDAWSVVELADEPASPTLQPRAAFPLAPAHV